MTNTLKCPKCGEKLIDIIYGLPLTEAFEAAERGEIILGGCCISPESPSYHCKKCFVDYSKDLDRAYISEYGNPNGDEQYDVSFRVSDETAQKVLLKIDDNYTLSNIETISGMGQEWARRFREWLLSHDIIERSGKKYITHYKNIDDIDRKISIDYNFGIKVMRGLSSSKKLKLKEAIKQGVADAEIREIIQSEA